MTVKELAAAFDMNVGEMGKALGYSRQALYNLSESRTSRALASYTFLELLNKEMKRRELALAEKRFEDRKKAMREFFYATLMGEDSQ